MYVRMVPARSAWREVRRAKGYPVAMFAAAAAGPA